MVLADARDRPLRDLRISVTDRCNMRCRYCMPREVFGADFPYLPRASVLSFEEIDRLAGLFVGLGVEKIRLTGGEPLLRRDLPTLVEMLAAHGAELAMTTNGVLLPRHAEALAAAGLTRVTVSLDALDEATFQAITDAGHSVAEVLAGIEAAQAAGMTPVKVNAVIKRGVNEDEVLPLVERFAPQEIAVRFIEFMDVGTTNGWALDAVVPAAELRAKLPGEALPARHRGEVAKRQTVAGGEVGFITSVTEPFCGDCTRARLSADGRLYTCLFANEGVDLLTPMRAGADDADLIEIISSTWAERKDAYSEERKGAGADVSRVEMSYIGG